MDTFKNLKWKFSDKQYTLTSGEKVIAIFIPKSGAQEGDFELNGEKFALRMTGFWKPKTTVQDAQGKVVMTVDNTFWGSNAAIRFENGKEYSVKIRNAPLVSLVFQKKEGGKLFRYKLSTLKCNPEVALEMKDTSIPENEFLLMLVFGGISMQGILQENTMNDTIIVLTAAA